MSGMVHESRADRSAGLQIKLEEQWVQGVWPALLCELA